MTNFVKKIALVLVATAGIVSASIAVAGSYLYEYVYYSNSSYSTVVGEKIVRCDGSTYVTGQVTQYKRLMAKEPCWGGGGMM